MRTQLYEEKKSSFKENVAENRVCYHFNLKIIISMTRMMGAKNN
jgi:hypothetical protein